MTLSSSAGARPVLYQVRALPGGHFDRLASRFDLRGGGASPAPRP